FASSAFIRVLLAAALATAAAIDQSRAQCANGIDCKPPRPQPGGVPPLSPQDSDNRASLVFVGGIMAAIIALIGKQLLNPGQSDTPTGGTSAPSQPIPPLTQIQLPGGQQSGQGGGSSNSGGNAGGGPTAPLVPVIPALRSGFSLPPAGATYDP